MPWTSRIFSSGISGMMVLVLMHIFGSVIQGFLHRKDGLCLIRQLTFILMSNLLPKQVKVSKKLNLNNKTCWPAISSLFRCCRHGGSQIEKDEKQRHFVDFAWYTEGSWYQLVVCMVYAIYCQLWRSLYPKRPQDTRKSGNFVNFSFIFHEYFRCEFFS